MRRQKRRTVYESRTTTQRTTQQHNGVRPLPLFAFTDGIHRRPPPIHLCYILLGYASSRIPLASAPIVVQFTISPENICPELAYSPTLGLPLFNRSVYTQKLRHTLLLYIYSFRLISVCQELRQQGRASCGNAKMNKTE